LPVGAHGKRSSYSKAQPANLTSEDPESPAHISSSTRKLQAPESPISLSVHWLTPGPPPCPPEISSPSSSPAASTSPFRLSPMVRLHWLEAVLPLGIIGGMLCIMGNAQYFIHKAAHGRPKHIGNDMWDVAMERRDKKLMEQSPGN
ncbi:hypothetical protein BAE44_0006209, partial [Dichanthelium oligosanthes]